MLLNPCPVCQDRQTCSCWVWPLNPWKIAPNPCLYILSHQGRNIFPVKVFPSLNRSAIILQAPERLRCLLYSFWAESHVLLKWLLSASEGCLSAYRGISSSSTWTSPWEGKQGDRWGEGKGRRRGAESRIGQLLKDHWESGLGCGSQHIHLDLRQARDWFPLVVL